MIRIVYMPVYDHRRHTKFVTEIDQQTMLDIKELHSISVVSDVSGERLHTVILDPNTMPSTMGNGGRGEPYGL